jgi:hypothetical protein
MDKQQAQRLADRLREQRERLMAGGLRRAAVIGRAKRAVVEAREARQQAAVLLARMIATSAVPIEIDAGQMKAVAHLPMSTWRNAMLLEGDAPRPGRRPRHASCYYFKAEGAPGLRHEGTGMAYYANLGPLSGPLLCSAGYFAIKVLQARKIHTPVGEALVAGHDQNGLALWRLTIDSIDLPGLYVVVDREFRPAE